MIVAPGEPAPETVRLHLKPAAGNQWQSQSARLIGRRTYEAFLGPFPARAAMMEYYVSAEAGGKQWTAPPEAPARHYLVTLL